ncbi:MAG: DUF3857 and transglutaminase domain-containing protein [Chlamydiales bacterium]|nr:DUF3857 and transglutaminase domain-containing protein [Chlamydiales bacterium]
MFSAEPLWVEEIPFVIDAPVKETQINLQYLLVDRQRNWEEKSQYFHYVVKAISQNGVEDVSQINIDFDPAETDVVMHKIRIYRDGRWVDRLANARQHTIQQEKRLNQNIYAGDVTLVFFIEDMRKNDILEYAYSLRGENPLFSEKCTDTVLLQYIDTVEKVSYRLLAHPRSQFLFKPFNTTIGARIEDISSDMRKWSYDVVNTEELFFEEGMPSWYYPRSYVQISQYQNWQEVVKELFPLYTLPNNFSEEMYSLVDDWKKSAQSDHDRAFLALRFVQDEIRYLGISEETYGVKPHDPQMVLKMRYGDCKDKAFLLSSLLHLMGIRSNSMLVNSFTGKVLPEKLPSPGRFNHVILQIEIDAQRYWVDPTEALKGGSLQQCSIPNYYWGLVLSEDTTQLTSSPPLKMPAKPIEISVIYSILEGNKIEMERTTNYYDLQADYKRRDVEWNGLKNISHELLKDLQKIHGSAKVLSPPTLTDDRENNVLAITETYSLLMDENEGNKSVCIVSSVIGDHLLYDYNPERKHALSLEGPQWIKETIHINNPFNNWRDTKEEVSYHNDIVRFSSFSKGSSNAINIYYELQYLQDHVPVLSLQEYHAIVKSIRNLLNYRIDSPEANQPKGSESVAWAATFVALLLACCAIYFTCYRK